MLSITESGDVMTEKTEKATAYKLLKAKRQGQVSKSTELIICIYLLVLLGIITALWPSFLIQLKSIARQLLILNVRASFSIETMSHLQQFLLSKITFLWMPFALTGILTIALATLAQTGFVWSTKPLAPDFKRLDMSKGFKRLFSSKMLFEAVKNSLKLSLVCVLFGLSLRHESHAFLNLIKTNPTNFPPLLMALFVKLLLQLVLLLLALALIDKLYTRWKFAKDNRMSKQELKDEYRQREGDPKIKSRIKQLQQKLRQKTASLDQIKTADVIITNPTHLAIALKYDRGQMPAPKVVCKAQGELVRHVKLLAARYQIPLVENKTFARALFATTELNQWISREHFPVAAMIFREIFRQRVSN